MYVRIAERVEHSVFATILSTSFVLSDHLELTVSLSPSTPESRLFASNVSETCVVLQDPGSERQDDDGTEGATTLTGLGGKPAAIQNTNPIHAVQSEQKPLMLWPRT